jgi:IclR family acetate operon transcriptional repressor
MDDEKVAAAPATVRSVERALDVLLALERSDAPLRLVDLSRQSGLHSATVLRLLGVLQRRGFVTVEHQGYRLGVAALGLAHGFLANDPISGGARPIMQQLSARSGMTVSLYARIDLDRILIARVDGADPLQYQIPVGRRLPLLRGAGKVIAASLDDDVREDLLQRTDDYVRPDGVHISVDELKKQLEQAREQGYFIHIGDRDLAVAAVSAPVRSLDGDVVASLSLSGPAERVSEEKLEQYLPELLRATAAIGTKF